jgi:histidinol-phosphate phosphatase family protein
LAERDLAAGRLGPLDKAHPRPAVFFDCDGVLNEEPGDPGAVKPDDIRLVPGAGAAVARARAAGMLTIAITNRPQVAKGLVTFEGLDHILGRLEALLAADGGVLDRLYFCPHHPEAGFLGEVPALKVRCECRKPGTLLFRQALAELPIDKSRSMLVGDSLRDIGAARALGISAYGVRTGYACRDEARYRRESGVPPVPDLMFDTVAEAVEFGIGYRTMAEPVLTALRPLLQRKAEPVLVGVGGRSRAGKSVMAHACVRTLTEDGVACLLVRLDDWITPVAERGAADSAEMRARVDLLPEVIAVLRSGRRVTGLGYNAASRSGGEPVTYDPAGQSVIVLEGSFAAHRSLRAMLDLTVFVDVPEKLQQRRFASFYRWKGLDQQTTDALWRSRVDDEWPAVDRQRDGVDLVVTTSLDEAAADPEAMA